MLACCQVIAMSVNCSSSFRIRGPGHTNCVEPVVRRGEDSMWLGSLKDFYLDELAILYDAELQIARSLPRFAEAAHTQELRETLAKQARDARLHVERIDLIFTHWGERRPLRTSA